MLVMSLSAVLMIAPACVGLAFDLYLAIGLLCIGGFAHQVISVLINTLTTDVFPRVAVARANGLVGMFGSRTLPKELVEKIGADVVAATKDPAVSARLSATAQTVNPGMPAEFAAAIQAQRDQIAKIAQELGIKPKVQP